MGVINTTPDSFSDGGALFRDARLDIHQALARARDMVSEGARVLDIGGESTRPGAAPVSVAEEMDRVLPLIERINAELDVVVSVDTSTPALMSEAARLGAGLINDVRALTREGALAAAADSGLPVCLMHMQGEPGSMQAAPHYEDVVSEVSDYLGARVDACTAAGIAPQRLLLDPGFGFGKTVAHNLILLRELPRLGALGFPLLVGLSRKSMIGKLLGREVGQRLPASLALALLAVERGAGVVRAHDVAATVDALAMVTALRKVENKNSD
ncbi:dihydropteroate synthase [Candidatus Marimicrobium litorale]|uniref:dihydropteroate synthase n=1 Tax=Candidatus Marimicrobium litorale TaxID=2518991 RepID=A0ABT3T643_9GAMM|nr:dihydropteroate synthase [Candidatus Marimicrobium litorale]MCX2977736.1 dihydropteroate synthase [Candidatus Marimicrobium litorale]